MINEITRRTWLWRVVQGGAAISGLPLYVSSGNADEQPQPTADIIDAHMHLCNTGLPGDPDMITPDERFPLGPFKSAEQEKLSAELAQALENEMLAANIVTGLCMPGAIVSDDDPLAISETLRLAALMKKVKLHAIGFANPARTDPQHLARVRDVLKQGKVKALKVYLGYVHRYASDAGYQPYYELSEEFGIPVVFHTGDVSSSHAKMRYCHPLTIDDVAVDHPKLKIVIAHAGHPWYRDTALVASKNENVYLDLSATLYGTVAYLSKPGVIQGWWHNGKRAPDELSYGGAFRKAMFGSDWPGCPLRPALDFVQRMFTENTDAKNERWIDAVLRGNAKKVFGV